MHATTCVLLCGEAHRLVAEHVALDARQYRIRRALAGFDRYVAGSLQLPGDIVGCCIRIRPNCAA